jgi:hypothetical protein
MVVCDVSELLSLVEDIARIEGVQIKGLNKSFYIKGKTPRKECPHTSGSCLLLNEKYDQ